MPAMVHELAAHDPEARALFSVEYTAPSWSLRQASGNDGLEDLIADVPWDAVVLQERSSYLSFSREWWGEETLPFALDLRRDIGADGAQPVVVMSRGYEHGNGNGDSYDGMQARVADGYEELADLLSADVAPVGLAWAAAVRARPELDLWKGDGRHPTEEGSYLAACVFRADGPGPSRQRLLRPTHAGGRPLPSAHSRRRGRRVRSDSLDLVEPDLLGA